MRRRHVLVVTAALSLVTGCGRYGFDEGGGPATEACDDIAGALVCSSFETDFDDWNLELFRGDATDECPAPRTGDHCLVATVDGGGGAARAWQMYPSRGEGTPLYLRMFARLDGSAVVDGINIGALDSYESGVYGPDLNVVLDGMFELYMDEIQSNFDKLGPVPRDEWFCLHLAMDVDDSTGSVSAGVGSSSVTVDGIDTFPNGAYDYVAVGVDWSSDLQGPITVMIDDVVVSTSPVPCPR